MSCGQNECAWRGHNSMIALKVGKWTRDDATKCVRSQNIQILEATHSFESACTHHFRAWARSLKFDHTHSIMLFPTHLMVTALAAALAGKRKILQMLAKLASKLVKAFTKIWSRVYKNALAIINLVGWLHWSLKKKMEVIGAYRFRQPPLTYKAQCLVFWTWHLLF